MKPKKCKHCGETFTPSRSMQQACSIFCAVALVEKLNQKRAAKSERQDKKAVREKLDAMKTKPELLKLAQLAFNSFIRARDADKPCICCGKPLNTGPNSFDAGHYRSVGSAPHLRFVENNVHGQTKYCNNYLASNAVGYRKGLIDRIGLEAVEALEADQTPRKYTHDELRDLAASYRAKLRELKKGQ
jgi:hypothetical protein